MFKNFEVNIFLAAMLLCLVGGATLGYYRVSIWVLLAPALVGFMVLIKLLFFSD